MTSGKDMCACARRSDRKYAGSVVQSAIFSRHRCRCPLPVGESSLAGTIYIPGIAIRSKVAALCTQKRWPTATTGEFKWFGKRCPASLKGFVKICRPSVMFIMCVCVGGGGGVLKPFNFYARYILRKLV